MPRFDVNIHEAKRIIKTAMWILDNVTYDNSESIHQQWAWHVDRFFNNGQDGSEVLQPMLQNKSWPFPPVIVEANFALLLGSPDWVGKPYHLIEATHRVSYLHRLVQLNKIKSTDLLEVIEIRERK